MPNLFITCKGLVVPLMEKKCPSLRKSGMHLFAFFILFLVIQSTITAQLTGYQFSQSGGTYSPIAGGTVWQTSAATINTDAVSSSIALPFTFTFNGSACDKVYISNNGFITLANTTTNVAPTSTTYNPISAATGYIAAISGYGFNLVGSTYTGAAPEIRYQTNGSAPNRTFVVQFKDIARSGFTGASADKMNFQIILNETTNAINLVYGTFACNTATTTAANFGQIGLRGASNTSFMNRMVFATAPYNTWASSGGGMDNGATPSVTAPALANVVTGPNCVMYNTSYMPTSGQTYTYTPIASSFYQSLPYVQNFETWSNLSSVKDVAGSGIITTPATGTLSFRNIGEAIANSLWYSNTVGKPTLGAAQGTGAACFINNAASLGTKGYMDLYLNFSNTGNKILTFDYINPDSTTVKIYVSTDGGLTFGASLLTIPKTATWATYPALDLGSSTSTTVVVRFEATSTFLSNYFSIDNISILPTCAAPTSAPTGLNFSSITTTSLNGAFTAAAIAPTGGYLVVKSTSSTLSANPVNGSAYIAGASLGGGTVLAVNSPSTYTFSAGSLTPGTQYYFFVIPYNYQAGTCSYSYGNAYTLSGNSFTCIAAPTGVTAGSITGTTASISWTAPSGTVTSYTLQWKPTSSGSWTTITGVTSPYTLNPPLTGLTSYDVQVSASNASCTSPYSSITTFSTLLSNDACSGAIVIPGAGAFPYLTTTISNTTATTTGDPTPSCASSFGHAIWYSFTPTTSGGYTFSTCPSDAPGTTITDDVISIFTGTCGALTAYDCDDDNGPSCSGTVASISSSLTAGNTYYIMISGYGTSVGNVQMKVSYFTLVPTTNDDCAGATVIPASGPFPYLTTPVSNATATATGDPTICASSGKSIYYKFTPTTTGTYTFSTCSADAPSTTISDDVMALFSGTCGSLVSVACDDDAGPACTGTLASISSSLTAGTTYYIYIGGYNSSSGIIQMKVSAPCSISSAPSVQPTSLILTPTSNSVSGAFTAASPAVDGYLVVRTNSSTAPSNPVLGTTYTAGTTALGGVIEYSGTATSFTSNSLSYTTHYWYWVFSYTTTTCTGGGPVYNTTSPLSGNTTTTSCVSNSTLYWAGTGSTLTGAVVGTDFNTAANWSTTTPSYTASGNAPTSCTNVSIILNNTVSIKLSSNSTVNNLTMNISGTSKTGILSAETYQLVVNGTTNLDVTSGNTSILEIGTVAASGGLVEFKGAVTMGATSPSSLPAGAGYGSFFVGNSTSRHIFRSNLTFGVQGGVMTTAGTIPQTAEFDGTGSQSITWNNTVSTARFTDVLIGNINSPTVTPLAGSIAPDNITGNLTIKNGAILDLGTTHWNRNSAGGTFSMTNTSQLKLGAASGGVIGSNFPSNFSTITFATGTTVEYNGSNAITQTIYNTPGYSNITLTNGSGSGTANKISTGSYTVNNYLTVNSNTVYTPGATDVIGGAGTLTGTGTVKVTRITGTPDFSSQFANAGAILTNLTVDYSGAGNQTISGINYGNLVISTNGTRTVTLANGGTVGVSGSFTPTATTTTYVNTGNTINFNGAAQSVPSFTYNVLQLTGTGTKTMAGNASIIDSIGINAGVTLAVSTYTITLKSSAAKTARVGTLPATSNITYGTGGQFSIERFITAQRAWRYLTAPVTSGSNTTISAAWQEGTKSNSASTIVDPNPGYGTAITYGSPAASGYDQGTNGSTSIKYQTSAGWTGVPTQTDGTTQGANKGIITDQQGYMLFIRGSRGINLSLGSGATPNTTVLRPKGQIRTGTQTISTPACYSTYKSVGNPYPSAINFHHIVNNGSNGTLPDAFYQWDPYLTGTSGSGGWVAFSWNAAKQWYDKSVTSSLTNSGDIESGSAIMIDFTGANIVINETDKVAGTNNAPFRQMMPDGEIRTTLYAENDDGSLEIHDGVLSSFNDAYNTALDKSDMSKPDNFTENFGIIRDHKTLSIERRGMITAADTMFFIMTAMEKKHYQLSFDPHNLQLPVGMKAVLQDLYLNHEVSLDENGSTDYPFDVDAVPGSYDSKRFRIVFRPTGTLPVTFHTVKATIQNKDILVEWKVENELNIESYDVEKSTDGIHFYKMGTVDANGGMSAYQWTDVKVAAGDYFYQIVSKENSGNHSKSVIVKVKVSALNGSILIYPNPVTGNQVNLLFDNELAGNYLVRVFDNAGKVMLETNLHHYVNHPTEVLMHTERLTRGFYRVEMTGPDGSKKQLSFIY